MRDCWASALGLLSGCLVRPEWGRKADMWRSSEQRPLCASMSAVQVIRVILKKLTSIVSAREELARSKATPEPLSEPALLQVS